MSTSALTASTSNQVVTAGLVGQTILGLIAVIAIILVLTWLIKRFNANRFFVSNADFKLINQFSIGQKQHIALVRVGKQFYLLGKTPHSITKIDVLNENPLANFQQELKNQTKTTSIAEKIAAMLVGLIKKT